MPGEARETTCVACRSGSALLIFDAGTGLRRLIEPAQAALLDGAQMVHLFLTHFHLDHTCGLAYLSGVLPGREVVVHAAKAGLTGVDPERALAGLLRRPYNPRNWEDMGDLRLEEVKEGVNHVAGHTIRVRAQQHSDVSVAYRLDDAFVLATDTPADPATATFAADADLLLHEAWYNAADARTAALPASQQAGCAAHSEVSAVAQIAKAAGVGRLVLMHLNPLLDESYRTALGAAARSIFPPSYVMPDGAVIDTCDALPGTAGSV